MNHKPSTINHSPMNHSKSGVALILVIGLLALMMVMAVAFAIYMRTERMAAGNFRNDVRVRQLLHAALARALEDLESNLGHSPYPKWETFASTNGTTPIEGFDNPPILDWVPLAPLASGIDPLPRWVDLVDVGEEGRIGYLVVNCSGLLDANSSGDGVSDRGIGTNVCEIQFDACPEVANAGELVDGRPYETIQELGQVGRASGALSTRFVSNFVCYSYFPTGYVGGTNITLVDLSGDDTALLGRRQDIVDGLIRSGIPADQAPFVFTNLLDYVDADSIPRDLGTACTESVPMFNEILVTNIFKFRSVDTNLFVSMQVPVSFEWFYPFVKPLANSYWIEFDVAFERAGTTDPAFPIPANTNGTLDSTAVGYTPGLAFAATCPRIVINTPEMSCTAFMGAVVQLRARVKVKMHQGSATGPVVDATPYPDTTTLDFTLPQISVPNTPATVNRGSARDAECADPRFNWSSTQWRFLDNANTVFSPYTNRITTTYLQSRDTDGHGQMFVADRPLASVAELTYLLRGGISSPQDYRWNTIRLVDWQQSGFSVHPCDTILDNFVIGTNKPVRGYVNPNSGQQEVLAAVFTNMWLNNYPDETNPPAFRLQDDTRNLVNFWVSTNMNPWRCNFTNLSDIGHATNVFNSAVLSGLTPFQKESFFRNTAGLLNTRQQYFKILLFAQTTKSVVRMTDKSVISFSRAIAEVWRDPLPNDEGGHPRVLRMFRIVTND